MHIDHLELSARSHRWLEQSGIKTVDALMKLSYRDLLALPNIGQKSAMEITWKMLRLANGSLLKEIAEFEDRYPVVKLSFAEFRALELKAARSDYLEIVARKYMQIDMIVRS